MGARAAGKAAAARIGRPASGQAVSLNLGDSGAENTDTG